MVNKFLEGYKIWNVSEYSYNTSAFNDQVIEYISTGYPNPSLIELFTICKKMVSWLEADNRNIVVIHCQKSRTRRALVLSCLLYEMGKHPHPNSGLTFVCEVS